MCISVSIPQCASIFGCAFTYANIINVFLCARIFYNAHGQGHVEFVACSTTKLCLMFHNSPLTSLVLRGVSAYRYNPASFLLNILIRGDSGDLIRGCSWMDVDGGWREGESLDDMRSIVNLYCCYLCIVRWCATKSMTIKAS